MKPLILESRYNPRITEEKWYKFWLEREYFHADETKTSPPYSIVIPPPNITGSLHMGHAFNNTIQDILIRWKRMDGFNALWMPGTDHAGIATQWVVEQLLAAEGTNRFQLGREKFVERVWQWRERSGGKIIQQLKRLGASCDWQRERFTMDEGLSRAVREVFVALYKEGLIYRGHYIINWCPRCLTALSDLEVDHEEEQGKLYYVHYHSANNSSGIIIATTRPETILGDSAVAVNPKDPRYRQLIGTEVIIPFVQRKVKVIADDYVDMAFGTGALKITPAHDPNDFEVGARHQLEHINIFDETAKMNEKAGPYQGLDRFQCRARLVEDLEKAGDLVKVEEYKHSIGHCYRCKTVVEPYLSYQWFVRMKDLAHPAIEAVKEGKIKFIPKNWENTYFEWMNNIRDWCISRQIWWGHRIPAWYCQNCRKMSVSTSDPTHCNQCGSNHLIQEKDVLDTWFSSGLWPFSTLGWPAKTRELQTFYPTSVLVTGFDILFFWVARMIMAGLKFRGNVPFRDVYIHALVRDASGQKMSKSKGNVIDPLTVMDEYGTDAFRFTLAAMAAPGRDILLSEDRIAGYRNFANKIWNAGRFALMNLDNVESVDLREFLPKMELPDRWILSRHNRVIIHVREALEAYRFDEVSHTLYHYIWHELCDWYIELVKGRLTQDSDNQSKGLAQVVLSSVLEETLRLLHPIMPFITEELWQHFPHQGDSIMIATYPTCQAEFLDVQAERDMGLIIEVVTAIRNIRGEMNIMPSQKVDVKVQVHNERELPLLDKHRDYLLRLGNIADLEMGPAVARPKLSATAVVAGMDVFLPIEGLVDIQEEKVRLQKELKKLQQDLQLSESKMSREDFISKAPPQVIAKEEVKLAVFKEKKDKLELSLAKLKEIEET